MKKDSRIRLYEVMGRLDKTFKPALNEGHSQLLDYFMNTWSTSPDVQKLINSNGYLTKKYGGYIQPDFDWSALGEDDLKQIWDAWAIDEESLSNMRKLGESEDKTFMLDGEEVYFKLERYDKNGGLAVELWDNDGPYARVSSNLVASSALPNDEFYLKHWGENEHLAQQLISQKVIIPTGEQEEELGARSFKIAPEYSMGGIVEEDANVHDGGGESVSEDNEFFEITAPVGSEDDQMFVGVVNQGIDSSLEAFTKSKFDIRQGSLGARRVFNFHKSELPILLRRLRNLGTEEGDSWANDIEGYDSNLDEIFGWSQGEKDGKALQQKIELAKQEVQKSPPGGTAFGQPAQTGQWSEPRYHKELMDVRLNLLRQDMPTVMELLPELFQDQSYSNAQFKMDSGNILQGYVLTNWNFLKGQDGIITKESGKEELLQMLNKLTQQ